MSRCLQSKLTYSQDLDLLDSFSPPSEPPDIRNWFSSYAYESPVLNTLDGLQDFDGSGETFDEEAKNIISGDSQPAGKSDDVLPAVSKKSSDEIKFNESDDFECSKSAALVTRSSESLSFSSEPPDIKNWFSSYLYESPPVDTAHDFSISDYKEREDDKLCNVQMSCREDEKNSVSVIDAKDRIELCCQNRNLGVVVRCSGSVIGTESDYQLVCKDVLNVALKPVPSVLSQLTSDKVSDPMLSGKTTANNDHGHVEMPGKKSTCGNVNDGHLRCSKTYKRNPMLINEKNDIGHLNGESVHKSIGRINHCKGRSEKRDLNEVVSPGTSELTVPKGDSRKRPKDRSRNRKENEENESPENGFVSIRKKSSQANGGNATRCVRVEVESLRNEVEPMRSHEKDAKTGRKVLSEISNFGSTNMQESSGKWRCPQKNKPDLGPPLKQLRLSNWFYRV